MLKFTTMPYKYEDVDAIPSDSVPISKDLIAPDIYMTLLGKECQNLTIYASYSYLYAIISPTTIKRISFTHKK